jgi:hypothetical protein
MFRIEVWSYMDSPRVKIPKTRLERNPFPDREHRT